MSPHNSIESGLAGCCVDLKGDLLQNLMCHLVAFLDTIEGSSSWTL